MVTVFLGENVSSLYYFHILFELYSIIKDKIIQINNDVGQKTIVTLEGFHISSHQFITM